MPAAIVTGPYVRVNARPPVKNATDTWRFQPSTGPYARPGELHGDVIEIWGRYDNACEYAKGVARDAEYIALLPKEPTA